jgi:hypothetical protein
LQFPLYFIAPGKSSHIKRKEDENPSHKCYINHNYNALNLLL